MSPQRAAMVALLRLGSRTWAEYAELAESRDGALPVLKEELTARSGQPSLLGDEPGPDLVTLLARAGEEIERWERAGWRLATVLEPGYPANLRHVHDRPALLFVAGSLLAADERSVAVIGSRRASSAGLAAAGAIARALVAARFTVVSGLAAGIDTSAHVAALDAGGRTIAVLGTGLARCYPSGNAALQRRIASECAVVSRFWPEEGPSRATFPLRNAVMSGLARASVIVEASRTSGARIQARLALAHGRPVVLLASLLGQAWARELAARPGVHVALEPDDVPRLVARLIADDAPITGDAPPAS